MTHTCFLLQDELQYGIDWEGPLPIEPEQIVTVPDTPETMRSQVYDILQQRINALGDSDCFGIDIFLEALQIARQTFPDFT